jgi:hypothetical protein
MKYGIWLVIAAVWGAGVASLWWAGACLELSNEGHNCVVAFAWITSMLSACVLLAMGLIEYD